MTQFFNQYSFVFSVGFLLAILGVVLLRSPQRKRSWLVLVGVAVAANLKFLYTPTFIFFDSRGTEAWRSVGRIDPQKVKDSLR